MSSKRIEGEWPAQQFLPDGRLRQSVCAKKMSDNGSPVVALKGEDGIVFAAGHRKSKLCEFYACHQIFDIDEYIGMAVSGSIADARKIVEVAQTEATIYRSHNGFDISLSYLNDRVSKHMQQYTLYGAVRPFGCNIILGSFEEDEFQMHMTDHSGVTYECQGCAIGRGKEKAMSEIEKLELIFMPTYELIEEAARIIHLVHGEARYKNFEVEMSCISEDTYGKHERIWLL